MTTSTQNGKPDCVPMYKMFDAFRCIVYYMQCTAAAENNIMRLGHEGRHPRGHFDRHTLYLINNNAVYQ